MRSIDLFDVGFTSYSQSKEEIATVEQQLLDKDFDAILFTKIMGSEDRQTFREKMGNVDKLFCTFSEDYSCHQDIYYDTDYYNEFTIYHVETSLYCICVDKERELIWRGAINVANQKNVDRVIGNYVKMVVRAMEDKDLIFHKGIGDEGIGI